MTSWHQVYGHAAMMDHAIVHLSQCSLSALTDCSFEAAFGTLLPVLLKGPLWGLIVAGILVDFGGFGGDLGGQFGVEGLQNHCKRP